MKLKSIQLFACSILSATVMLAGMPSCSSGGEDEPGGKEEGGTSSPYHSLPTGNSNMPSSGTVVAQYSDAPEACSIAKLVDGDTATKYRTRHNSFHIIWNGNSNVAVLSYSLTSADDAPEMDPKAWTLEGSTDGQKWKEIDRQKDQTFGTRKETKHYEVENNVTYRYYRLTVSQNAGSESTQIAEWTLSAATSTGENIDDLLKLASGKTASQITPMGTIHESDRKASAQDLEWLKDATAQPQTFDNLNWKTFDVTGTIYPFGDPLPADINQHSVGDCCALAVMADLAYTYPKYIKSILKEKEGNTYAVTLFDPQGKPVEVCVDNFFVADGDKLGACSGKTNNVTWATIIEKALIKWLQVYKGTSSINGIATEYVAAILTGSGDTYSFAPGVLSAKDLKRAVVSLIMQRQLVIGGFQQGDKPIDGKYKSVNFHAYNFLLPPGDKYLFVMRNPWGLLPLINGGYSDGKEDGLLQIEDDGVIPPIIDLRICNPGAAKGYASQGSMTPYTPPSYQPAPMRISRALLALQAF